MECEAARLQVHGMEVQRMKDKETVRQQFEEIEHAFVRSSMPSDDHYAALMRRATLRHY